MQSRHVKSLPAQLAAASRLRCLRIGFGTRMLLSDLDTLSAMSSLTFLSLPEARVYPAASDLAHNRHCNNTSHPSWGSSREVVTLVECMYVLLRSLDGFQRIICQQAQP